MVCASRKALMQRATAAAYWSSRQPHASKSTPRPQHRRNQMEPRSKIVAPLALPIDPLKPGKQERTNPHRFHATATLNHGRIGPDASRIAEEVVSHPDGLVGSEVKITLEIEVVVPAGVPEHVERMVTENSAALRIDSHAFEQS